MTTTNAINEQLFGERIEFCFGLGPKIITWDYRHPARIIRVYFNGYKMSIRAKKYEDLFMEMK